MADLRRWLLLLRIPAVLLGVFLFFALYNRFVVDANLRSLKTSVSILEAATGIGQAEAALLMVDQTLVAEMAREETELERIAALQYAQGALSTENGERPVEDVKILVGMSLEERIAERPGFIEAVDNTFSAAQAVLRQAALLPRRIMQGRPTQEMDAARLEEAIRLERLGKVEQAIPLYEGLILDFPRYADRSELKLRLGYLVQRSRDFRRARALFKEAAAEARDPKVVQAALVSIQRLPVGEDPRIRDLEKKLDILGPGLERQRAAFELGTLLIRSYQMEKAAQSFLEARQAAPQGELALAALFKGGWSLRYLGRLEEAGKRFHEIILQDPKSPWVAAAYLQMAELYKATGDYPAATWAYEQAIEVSPRPELTAAAHAFTGATYLFDLNDPEKAEEHLSILVGFFPASPFSAFSRKIKESPPQEISGLGKGPRRIVPGPQEIPEVIAPLVGAGSPLMIWLENFLPLFVEVFAERLARYMEVAGEKELTRRFTEEEFHRLVLRRVQERFPGQVTDVTAKIRPDGFLGAGKVQFGPSSFLVSARVGIALFEERPHAVVEEIHVGKFTLPKGILKLIETRVNQAIDKRKYPLKVKQYELRQGYANISVELYKE